MSTTPTTRAAWRILWELRDGRDHRAADVRRAIGGYDGGNGQRKWRRHLKFLRDRGLVREHGTGPQGEMIRSHALEKPLPFHLSTDEHRALAFASAQVRQPTRDHFEISRRLLRELEHEPDGLEVAELQARLGLRHDEVEAHLDLLRGDEQDDTRVRVVSVSRDGELVELIEASIDDDTVLPDQIGAGEFGFFGYTLDEADERLAIIEKALPLPACSEVVDELIEARYKLTGWREHLASRLGKMS